MKGIKCLEMSENNKDLEDLKFITELFGNKDLEPEEEVETLEEIQAELKELGFDLSELSQQMETLRAGQKDVRTGKRKGKRIR